MVDDEENRKVKMVSEFLQKSCRRRPSHRLGFAKLFHGLPWPVSHPVDGFPCKIFPMITGSVAEFYIEPMLSCVGDTDVMYHYSNELAIPQSHPPPTQLPKDFENRVKVYEFVDSRVPGYVYVNLTYVLSRDIRNDKYIVVEHISSADAMLNNELHLVDDDEIEIHGPAYMFIRYSPPIFLRESGFMIDTVPCIRCFMWPPQAADWPKRHRNHGWPDSATADCVIGKGCDLVGVAYRQCREDEWMSKRQWRLSFSRAEIVLLNSWMPEQQIIYHMLRIFVKTERLTDSAVNCGADTLSNYHIKTLMLWACELKPQHWWNDGSTVVKKFFYLLQFLEEWLTKWRGEHYFINRVHFHIDKFITDTISAVLKSSTEDSLAQWFVNSYVVKCAKLCPDSVSIFCSDLITGEIPNDMLNAILHWRDHVCSSTLVKQTALLASCCVVPMIYCFTTTSFECRSIVQDQVVSPIALSLPHIDKHALQAFILILMSTYSLKPYYKTIMHDFVTHVSRGSCRSADEISNLESSKLHSLSNFQTSVNLMELVANKHRNTCELILVELSKLSLQRSLQCNNPERDSVRCLALLYLSVLYYITGQCQLAIDHLTLVTNLQDHRCKCTSHIVEGKFLPKIDDNIDIALGLAVFYQHILTAALKQKQPAEQVSVFTLELFACYFTIKHLLVAKCHCVPRAREKEAVLTTQCYLREELNSCFSTISSSKRLFTSDLMLCKLSNNLCRHGGNASVIVTHNITSGIDRRQMVNFVSELSLQQLLTHRHLLPPMDTKAIAVNNRSDLIALYLYRCQLYEQCNHLCQQRIHDLIGADSCDIPRVSIMYHEFIELMDDDVVSLFGLTLLLRKTGTCRSWFREPITVTQLTLSLSLFLKCQFSLPRKGPVDLGALAVVLDWIASALKTIPASESVDHLMLKLAEREAIMYIMRKLTGIETLWYGGDLKIDVAFDVLRGLQLAIRPTHTDDILRSKLNSGDRTVWLCNGARSELSDVDFRRLRKEDADALTVSLQIQIHVPVRLRAELFNRLHSVRNCSTSNVRG